MTSTFTTTNRIPLSPISPESRNSLHANISSKTPAHNKSRASRRQTLNFVKGGGGGPQRRKSSGRTLTNIQNLKPSNQSSQRSSRRKTLAPKQHNAKRRTTAAAVNRRLSVMQPQRRRMTGHTSNNTVASRRKSLAPGNRRQSVKGSSSKEQQRAELVHQTKKIRRFLELSNITIGGGKGSANADKKLLASPNGKEFIAVLNALVSTFIDGNFHLPASHEHLEEIPKVFAWLGYPYRLNRSQLRSMGSVGWPLVVAALSWLVDVIIFNRIADEANWPSLTMIAEDKVFFEFLSNAYEAFLNGENEFGAYQLEMEQTFQKKNETERSNIAAIEQENDTLRAQIKELEAECKMDQLKQRKLMLQSDCAKLSKYIHELEEHENQLKHTHDQLVHEEETRRQDVKAFEQEKATLQQQLKEQEQNAVNIDRLVHEKQRYQKDFEQLCRRKQSLEQSIEQSERQYTRLLESVEQATSTFNQQATSFQLIPHSAKYASNIQYELHLDFQMNTVVHYDDDDDAEQQGGTTPMYLSNDVKHVIKPGLVQLRKTFDEKYQTARQRTIDLEDESARLNHQIDDIKDKLKSLRSQFDREKASLQQEKRQLSQELEQLEAKSDALWKDTQRLKEESTQQFNESQNQLASLKQHADAVAKQIQKEKELCQNILVESLEQLSTHKAYIQNNLNQVKNHMVKKFENLNCQ
eukprot:CAMPEP_0201551192 /NCGR_PEP_ID=MMETSP0173_2-20130828/7408_1 /ASSEMBLY_ACC=CAM_ASM_000268 /TAXON_ID=218659 /ORGANISM="Vexillifera sp., Strain DIVA3 564/2" /LENGTH=693 /DNA_ID=CAMNT_0047961389 /DNA_START=417 /DNA_END=2498 /DNA_ORIENTATION=-